MTLIVAWISRDQNKPSAAYIAADSRISQGNSYWDCGKKVFASKTQPMIFGYCGSVLVPSLLLAQVVDTIDSNLLFDGADAVATKWQAIHDYLEQGLKGSMPFMAKEPSYLYAFHRVDRYQFSAACYTINGLNVAVRFADVDPKESSVVKVLGSGAKSFGEVASETKRRNSGVQVARIHFASFCRTIECNAVPTVGGPPQLAALRTKGVGHIIPVKFHDFLWHQGLQIDSASYVGECFDETFQRINPQTLDLVDGAQLQPLN